MCTAVDLSPCPIAEGLISFRADIKLSCRLITKHLFPCSPWCEGAWTDVLHIYNPWCYGYWIIVFFNIKFDFISFYLHF